MPRLEERELNRQHKDSTKDVRPIPNLMPTDLEIRESRRIAEELFKGSRFKESTRAKFHEKL